MASDKTLKEFYFEAMRKQWGQGTRKKPKNTVPGHEMFVFQKEDLTLVELRAESLFDGGISGMINIFDEGNLAWSVHYSGFCEKRARTFLREVLSKSFRNGNGASIRGPRRLEEKKLAYVNLISGNSGFARIRCYEKIIKVAIDKPEDKILAEISFFGGLID
ncbi:MAG TPA: hypothetical protein P5080_02915 [Candidatus Paceibacterota bacterium]|nr:hypothetical protein [Candidatus Pacearchaeota archaeon]HRZ50919.1 hypothetical protein [Candidatus Paceibacterota bacterium]HSA36640.1 hypothetical protein [Candidatus Paceibacterota bacterium]